MGWFKHEDNASEDAFIHRLEDEFGDAGYAAYFKILELMRSNLDPKMPEKLVCSRTLIRQKLRKRWTTVELYLNYCKAEGKLLWFREGEKITVILPKFKEVMDKYARRIISEKYPLKIPQVGTRVPHRKEKKRRDIKDPSYRGLRKQYGGAWLGTLLPGIFKKILSGREKKE